MKKLFTFFMTLLLIFGCEEVQPAPEAMITLDTEQSRNISIPSEGGVADISFTSALDWTAGIEYDSGEEGWISLNLTSGKGGYSIVRLKLNIHENLDPEKRSANVVIASGTEKVSISVTQDGHQNEGPIQEETPVFKLSDKKAEVGAEGGRIQVTVEFNVDYYYEISADWIKEVETKSVDSRIHTFEIAENTDETPRTGTISFCGNYSCIPFSVTQAAAEPKPYLDIDVETLYMPVAGRSEKVGIASNVAWKVECDAEWLSVSPVAGEGDGSIDVNASANDGTELRSAVISISAADGSIVRSLVVIQEAEAKVFELKDKAADVGAEGGFIYVTVRHNVDYRCEVSSDWIKEIETKAIAENIHTFEIAANPSEESRSAVISFSGNGETIPFTVNQAGAEPETYLELSTLEWHMPADYDYPLVVDVSSNVSWQIEFDIDWITIEPMSGSGDGSFSITVDENKSEEFRKAQITVMTDDGSVRRDFVLLQDGKIVVFELNDSAADIPSSGGKFAVTARYNVDYEVEIPVDWIREVVTRNADERVHTFVVDENPSEESRSAVISFIGNGETIDFTVYQAESDPKPYLEIDSESFTVGASGTSEPLSVNVTSNVVWNVECASGWLSYEPTSGEGNGVVSINVSENEDVSKSRNASVRISSADGNISRTLVIVQEAAVKIFDLSDSSIRLSSDGGKFAVTVRYNVDYTVDIPVDWIREVPTKSADERVHTFVAYANASAEPRSAVISFAGNGETIPFTVEQDAYVPDSYLELSTGGWSMPADYDGDPLVVNVSSNTDWLIEDVADWVIVDPVSGSGNGSFSVNVSKNEKPRETSFTVRTADGRVRFDFSVNQGGYIPRLELSTSGWSSLPADYDGALVVNVSSDTDWLIEDVADWVIVDPVSGSGNGSFSVNVRKNESEKPRETSFTVRTSDGSVKRVFSVNQEGYIPRLKLSTSGWSSLPADYDGDPLVVNVSSDTDWLIEDVADWVIVDPVSGSGNGSFSVNVRKNESEKPRETSFTVRTSDGSVKRVFSVNQEGAEPYFRLDSQAAEVKAEGGKVAVTVIANIEYSYEIPVEWIKEVDVVGNVHTFEIEANEDISQRRATISFCGNGNCLPFIITQAGKIPQHVLEVDRKDISVPALGTDAPLKVNVTSDTSWNVESDSGWCMVTPSSGINNGAFNVTVGKNASSEPRVALITVSSSDGFASREIAVIQAPASSGTEDDSWIQEEFVHRSLMMRFTADWCGYCPIMATSVHMAQEELPDKIEALSVHGGGSGLASRASDALVNHYGIGSFPTGLVDGRTQIQNNDPSVTAERIINAVNDTEAKYETLTGASWTSSVDGSQVVLNLSLYMKKSGFYKVTALLVEDGIIGYQADYTNGSSENYEHNGVIRSAFTEATGDEFTQLEEGQRKDFNYSVNIPYGCNKDNLKIVVYVQKREKGSFYVDNAASAAVGQTKMLAVKSGNWGSGNEGIVPGDDINL